MSTFIQPQELEDMIDNLKDNRPVEQIFGCGAKIIVKKHKKNNKVDVTLQYASNADWLTLWKNETTTPTTKGDVNDMIADMTLELEGICDINELLVDVADDNTVWYKTLTENQKKDICLQSKEFITAMVDIMSGEMTNTTDLYNELLAWGLTKDVLDLLEVVL